MSTDFGVRCWRGIDLCFAAFPSGLPLIEMKGEY
jgi:hypothetical protein